MRHSRRIVQLVHQSVVEFLLQDGFRFFYEQLPGDHLNGSVVARGHFWISRACIKYISMEEVVSLRISDSENDPRRSALFREHSKRFVFIGYASEYWIAHAQIVEREDVPQDDLVALFQPDSSVLRALHEWNRDTTDRISDDISSVEPGMTLLHIASRFGLSRVVRCILERDTRNTEVNSRDDDEKTPLHYAARAGHEAVVKHLLGSGAAVESRSDRGWTPAMEATYKGHKNIVELLLNWRAKADTMDDRGDTPLFHAARRGFRPIVELLLENGAQVNTTAKDGITAILWAVYYGRVSVVRLLLEHGADPDSINDKVISPAAQKHYDDVL